MDKIIDLQNIPKLLSQPSVDLTKNTGDNFHYALNKEELEYKLMQKIESFVLIELSKIDFEKQIQESWQVMYNEYFTTNLKFFIKIIREIFVKMSLDKQEEIILKNIAEKYSFQNWLNDSQWELARVLSIQICDILNIIMLGENFWLSEVEWMKLVHKDIVNPKHKYNTFKNTLSGKIRSGIISADLDFNLLYTQIWSKYQDISEQTIDENKVIWTQGIMCILKYKFIPHLKKKCSYSSPLEGQFYSDDYYSISKNNLNKKRKFKNTWKTKKEHESLEYVEWIITFLLEKLENIDYTKSISAHGIVIEDLHMSYIQKYFKDTVKEYIRQLTIWDIIPSWIFNRSSPSFVTKNLPSFLWTWIADILTLLMVHINFWISDKECKRIIYTNMRDGVRKKPISSRYAKITSIWIVYWEEEIRRYIDIWLNSDFIHNYSDEPRCPYFKSLQKKEFIDTMWEILKNKFLPALEEIFSDKEIIKKNELFLLWKYKDTKPIKKEA